MNRRHDSVPVGAARERSAAPAGAPDPLAAQARLQQRIVAALAADPRRFGPECSRVVHLETHISHVLLTGPYAYKIKKPVALGFLDFGTLAARRHFCEEELRLNRRLAPALYLDVVAIGGTADAPVVGGGGPALEYAVKMREFAQEALASRRLARGEFGAADVDALAGAVAAFHARIAVAPADALYGTAEDVRDYASENFRQVQSFAADAADRAALGALADWTAKEFAARADALRRRRAEGFVRECHGDLHLGNIAEVGGELVIFDGIEFNDHLRWIDVMSEVAFTTMDLEDRGRPDLAHRFLNAYLEATGDYAGLAVLRYYLVYRALVRAKVAALRARQLAPGAERDALRGEFRGYLALAQRLTRPPRPAIVVTHGVAGCGKTTATQELVERIGAIRVRTDVERKRLYGLAAGARSGSALDVGLYTAAATAATYARVRAAADAIVGAGDVAIADGTFLARAQRDLLRALAAERGVPFVVLAFEASEATVRERVAARAARGTDASEADLAVLERQFAVREPLAPDEQADVVAWDAEAPPQRARDPAPWRDVLARLTAAPSLAAKVAFLSRPASYPERTGTVLAIETHMSWVFLTERHAWKLKKPVRYAYLDFATVEAREHHCAEEVRLNRRLSPDVYLAAVPLTHDAAGLAIGGDGSVVDWLVKMRRLPSERMLDRLIRARAVPEADLRNAIGALCRFHRDCPRIALEPEAYRDRLAAGLAANLRALAAPEWDLPAELHAPTGERLGALLHERAAAFAERVRAGRIVEGHGDLRPEHVCLTPEPKFIDCLEFARDFRIVDTADELAFLALECEQQGAPELKATIFAACAEASGDAPPAPLVHFYQAHRALLRARIALWHIAEPAPRDGAAWRARAHDYLRLARAHALQCG